MCGLLRPAGRQGAGRTPGRQTLFHLPISRYPAAPLPLWSGGRRPGSMPAKKMAAGPILQAAGDLSGASDVWQQIDLWQIRPVIAEDKTDGFDSLGFVEHSRFNCETMFHDLCDLAETEIADVPLRRLVLTLLEAPCRRPQTIAGHREKILSVCRRTAGAHPVGGAYLFAPDQPLCRGVCRPGTAAQSRSGAGGAILHDIGRAVEFDDKVDNAPADGAG